MKRALLAFLAVSCAAQPRLTNANLKTQALSGDTVSAFNNLARGQTAPAWFAYAVESTHKDNDSCCWDQYGRGCRLENNNGHTGQRISSSDPIKLEGSGVVYVLYRVENGEVGKIRTTSENCSLDAGGLPFVWLTGMNGASSVTLLKTFLAKARNKHDDDSALAAITQHAAREATDALIEYAKSGDTSHMRGQALFWLAQRAGERSAQTIKDAIENDPDTEVKKKAVFALDQLPRDEGVPLLIQVARNNHNREVRKQAIFWLGQTNDPRALAFFEEILNR